MLAIYTKPSTKNLLATDPTAFYLSIGHAVDVNFTTHPAIFDNTFNGASAVLRLTLRTE